MYHDVQPDLTYVWQPPAISNSLTTVEHWKSYV